MTDDILVVNKLTKQFGGLKAVGGQGGLSFNVKRGALVGLIGPNGAGKSTTFNLISGVLEPSSGSVALNGKDLSNIKSSEIASHGLGRTFQTPRAFTSLSVLENVMVGEPTKQILNPRQLRFSSRLDWTIVLVTL